jgi:hypothetical protein
MSTTIRIGVQFVPVSVVVVVVVVELPVVVTAVAAVAGFVAAVVAAVVAAGVLWVAAVAAGVCAVTLSPGITSAIQVSAASTVKCNDRSPRDMWILLPRPSRMHLHAHAERAIARGMPRN